MLNRLAWLLPSVRRRYSATPWPWARCHCRALADLHLHGTDWCTDCKHATHPTCECSRDESEPTPMTGQPARPARERARFLTARRVRMVFVCAVIVGGYHIAEQVHGWAGVLTICAVTFLVFATFDLTDNRPRRQARP